MAVLVLVLCIAGLVYLWNRWRKLKAAESSDSATETFPSEATDLFDSAPIGHLEIDREGVVRRVNSEECNLRDRAKADLIGRQYVEFLPEPERDRCREQIQQKLAGKIPLTPYQRETQRPDGARITVEVHEHLLRNASDHVIGLRMSSIDVTERKQSENAAYQNAAELRALFQAFPDLFLRLDRDGRVLDAQMGQSSDPFLKAGKFAGGNVQDLFPPDVLERVRSVQEKVRKTGAVEVIEFQIDDRLGQEHYEMRLLPVNWDEWIAIVRNISERKADEQKLKEAALDLEQKNQQLEIALAAARDATRTKSRFLANMSHEIRTPMNGVLGMTEFLLGTQLDQEQLEYAHSIQRSAGSLMSLINDILDFSCIEAGSLRLDRVVFSLRTAIEQTASEFAEQARGKGLEFVSSIAPEVPDQAEGDPARLRQVLANLVGNAIKFTEHGRVAMSAELLSRTRGQMRLRFTVRDTGIGIAREDRERLFGTFTQADDSNTRKYGGTGLGLSIAKHLVELLGGEIGVESESGGGSIFWFTANFGAVAKAVPVAPAAPAIAARPAIAMQPAIASAPLPANPQPVAAGTTMRILLAEDNEINTKITLRLLQKLGLSADAVVNGRQAVEALEKQKYDLVLMDCQMPDMDGFEATAVIRSREGQTRHQTICALTANAMAGDRERCLAAGMDDYISKPVGLEKLRDALVRWIPSVAQAVEG